MPDATPRLPAGATLVVRTTVGSTNDDARALGLAGAGDGTWVWALRQEQGRGRRGRLWESPEGNLYCSVLLRPGRPLQVCAQLSFAAALAVRDAVLAATAIPESEVRLKWPNDVLVRGRKICGILLEAEPAAGDEALVVAGIGVNLRHCPTDTAYPATTLAAEAESAPHPAEFLTLFAHRFHHWYELWRQQGFAPLRSAWLSAAQGLGGPITVRLPAETLEGWFRDLDQEGGLLLDLPCDGPSRRIAAGDVFFGAPTP